MVPFNKKRRVNERLLEYWRKLKQDRPFPEEVEVNPEAIASIWESCFVVRVEDVEALNDFRYVYLGQSLVEAYGDDLNSKEVCERLAYPANNDLMKRFADVVNQKAPATEESEFTNTKGMVIKFRSCMVPLARDNPHEVGYILGAMSWKAV